MALTYKLIARPNLGKDKDVYPTKLYAQAIKGEEISFDELATQCCYGSTVTAADFKAVLILLGTFVSQNLTAGRKVNLGPLGALKLSFGSEGVISEDKFHHSLIRKPSIKFTPGKELQESRLKVKIEKLQTAPNAAPDEEDRPGEI